MERERDERGRFVKVAGGLGDKKLGLRLDKKRAKKLQKIAALKNKTIHEVVREILNDFLDNYEFPKD